jgi:DNA-directed RNA polymerase subunit RPC12/RpoP
MPQVGLQKDGKAVLFRPGEEQFIEIDETQKILCPQCSKLVAKGPYPEEAIEVKCKRCGSLIRLQAIRF